MEEAFKLKRVYFYITGGLGNQLFQLAYALSNGNGTHAIAVGTIGNPRVNSEGFPDILDYELPAQVHFLDSKPNKFLTKTVGYLLRSNINPSPVEEKAPYRKFVKFLGGLVVIIHLQRILKLQVNQGVGFSKIQDSRIKSSAAIGYFQSYKWVETPGVYETLLSLKPKVISQQLQTLKELSIIERPLVVHFRFGDYVQEGGFGIPSEDYYIESISQMWGSGKYKKIWAFSDEPDKVSERILSRFGNQIRWIPMIENSSALTLEAMRMGHGYVIANSTFSWWGAFLSSNKNPDVIAPNPWFKSIESPIDLIPPRWSLKEAF